MATVLYYTVTPYKECLVSQSLTFLYGRNANQCKPMKYEMTVLNWFRLLIQNLPSF